MAKHYQILLGSINRVFQVIMCFLNFKSSIGPYDTDFRGGHMGNVWKNDIYDTPQFDWTTHRGATNTEGTGPYQDHLGNIGKI